MHMRMTRPKLSGPLIARAARTPVLVDTTKASTLSRLIAYARSIKDGHVGFTVLVITATTMAVIKFGHPETTVSRKRLAMPLTAMRVQLLDTSQVVGLVVMARTAQCLTRTESTRTSIIRTRMGAPTANVDVHPTRSSKRESLTRTTGSTLFGVARIRPREHSHAPSMGSPLRLGPSTRTTTASSMVHPHKGASAIGLLIAGLSTHVMGPHTTRGAITT